MSARLSFRLRGSLLPICIALFLLSLGGCTRQPDPEFSSMSSVTVGTGKNSKTTKVPKEIEDYVNQQVVKLTGDSPNSLKMLGAEKLVRLETNPISTAVMPPSYLELDVLHELYKPIHDPEDGKYEESDEYEEIEEFRTRFDELETLRQNYLQVVWRGKFDANRMAKGRAIYNKRCVQCHSFSGDGNGPQAKHLYPRPRDYRKGKFKFISTGTKALHSDLVKTVTRGVTGTSMPSFERLKKNEIEAVVDYVLALTHRGEFEEKLTVMLAVEEGLELPQPPAADADDEAKTEYKEDLADYHNVLLTQKLDVLENILKSWTWDAQGEGVPLAAIRPLSQQPRFTAEHIQRGKQLYIQLKCAACHDDNGRALLDGFNKFDDWNERARAADLTSGIFHGGEEPIDIYRRLYVGIDGTVMPSAFKSDTMKAALSKNPEMVWDLVAYVLSLSEQRRAGITPPAGKFEIAFMRDVMKSKNKTKVEKQNNK